MLWVSFILGHPVLFLNSQISRHNSLQYTFNFINLLTSNFKLACIVGCNNAALALIATKGAEILNSCARSLTVAIQENLRCVFDSQTCCNRPYFTNIIC